MMLYGDDTLYQITNLSGFLLCFLFDRIIYCRSVNVRMLFVISYYYFEIESERKNQSLDITWWRMYVVCVYVIDWDELWR